MNHNEVKKVNRVEWLKTLGVIVGYLVIVYIVLSCSVFKFRHPYLTETEQALHLWDALTWKRLRYEDVRPRGQ